ncbi:MAG: SH3 domain-containing protein [Hyphomicrobium sp.]|jgi:hypothetical protein
MLRHLIAAGAVVAATAAAAEMPTTLSGQAIKETLAGAVLEVDAPFGTKLPVQYSNDGQISGQAGGLAFFLGSASDRGRWWVTGDRLCHKWTRWFDGEPQCLRLQQQGNRIRWRRDDGETGTATISSRPDPGFAQAPYALGIPQPPDLRREAAPRQNVAGLDAGLVSSVAAEKPTAVAKDSIAKGSAAKEKPRPYAIASAAGTSDKAKTATTAAKPKAPAQVPQEAPASQPQKLALAVPHPSAAHPAAEPANAARSRQLPKENVSALGQSFRVAGVENDDVLNIRRGPSSEDDVVGAILSEGRGVRLAGPCKEDWCPIVHGGVRGWVNRYYLAEETEPRLSAWPAQTGGQK